MNMTKEIKIMAIVMGLLIFSGIAFAEGIGTRTSTNDGYYASTSKALLEKTTTLVMQSDYRAVERLVNSGLVMELREGVEVVITNMNWSGGLIKIRAIGTLVEVWTYKEAVK